MKVNYLLSFVLANISSSLVEAILLDADSSIALVLTVDCQSGCESEHNNDGGAAQVDSESEFGFSDLKKKTGNYVNNMKK